MYITQKKKGHIRIDGHLYPIMLLEVDHRESKLLQILNELDVPHVSANLDVGDIRICHEDKVQVVIERKTLQDLASSISDGRYRDQKYRMLDNYGACAVMYVIEGNIWKDGQTVSSFSTTSEEGVKGAIINTLFRDGLRIMSMDNVRQTAQFIADTYKRMSADPAKYMKGTCDLPKQAHGKRTYVTKDVFFAGCLCQVPGVSNATATVIVEHYGTLARFVENASVDVIATLKMASGKRKIGSKLAESIMSYVYNNNIEPIQIKI